MPRQTTTLLLLLVALLHCPKMSLAQSSPLSLQQVVAASGFIFSGKVIKVWSERDSATGFIITSATIAVQDAVRGVNDARFTFKQYGGSYHGVKVFVADMSYFTEGEEIVAFLYPASVWGLTSPIGTNEGKLTIQYDSATGKKFLVGNFLHDQMLMPPLNKIMPSPAATGQAAHRMEYDRFLKLIRAIADRHRR
jgi:hypothetical protein